MKILHIVSNISRSSGIMTMIMNYYRYIDRDKVQFGFLYYDKSSETFEDEIIRLGGETFYICRPTHIVAFRKDINKLSKRIKDQYDVMHIHDFFMPVFFTKLKNKAHVAKMVVHSHVSKFSDVGGFSSLRNRFLALPNALLVEHYFASSAKAGNTIFGKEFNKKGTVIKNAIDVSRFYPDGELAAKARHELGIDGKFVIGHIGNLYPPKNHYMIIDIFRELIKKKSNAVLVLVGDGPLRKEIEEYAYDVKDHLIMLGLRADTDYLYRSFDRFLFPSKFEGLGIALIEAQACGVPCVFSDMIPEEANVNQVTNVSLSLSAPVDEWCNALLQKKDVDSDCVLDLIRDAGYDISKEASHLISEYSKILH